MADLIIKVSKIHGKGVFANRDFYKGEVIIEWLGEIFTTAEVERLTEIEKSYCTYYDDGAWILFDEPGRYMNHSCDANTSVVDRVDIANRDIKKGEEITADYQAEQALLVPFVCNCQHEKCLDELAR